MIKAGAIFCPKRIYRYSLWRRWRSTGRHVHWIMLNPSTADELRLDPSVTRCIGYTRDWGYAAAHVSNIFALRSTDPKALYHHLDPVGPGNNAAILRACESSSLVIVAWGIHGRLNNRGKEVLRLLAKAEVLVHSLHVTKDGHPGHPLYLPKSRKPSIHPLEVKLTRIIRKTVRPEMTETERMFVMLVDVIGRKNGDTTVSEDDILITTAGVSDIVWELEQRGLIHSWRNAGGPLEFTLSEDAEREARRWLGATLG